MGHNHFPENLLLSASIVKIDLKPLSTSPNGHTPGILSNTVQEGVKGRGWCGKFIVSPWGWE